MRCNPRYAHSNFSDPCRYQHTLDHLKMARPNSVNFVRHFDLARHTQLDPHNAIESQSLYSSDFHRTAMTALYDESN
jgi:hypothetical protein